MISKTQSRMLYILVYPQLATKYHRATPLFPPQQAEGENWKSKNVKFLGQDKDNLQVW